MESAASIETAPDEPKTLLEANRHYADLDVATKAFAALRWPDGPVCPHCESKESCYAPSRRIWKCKLCRKQFSPKVGTVWFDPTCASPNAFTDPRTPPRGTQPPAIALFYVFLGGRFTRRDMHIRTTVDFENMR
jgi:hypothetical protein